MSENRWFGCDMCGKATQDTASSHGARCDGEWEPILAKREVYEALAAERAAHAETRAKLLKSIVLVDVHRRAAEAAVIELDRLRSKRPEWTPRPPGGRYD